MERTTKTTDCWQNKHRNKGIIRTLSLFGNFVPSTALTARRFCHRFSSAAKMKFKWNYENTDKRNATLTTVRMSASIIALACVPSLWQAATSRLSKASWPRSPLRWSLPVLKIDWHCDITGQRSSTLSASAADPMSSSLQQLPARDGLIWTDVRRLWHDWFPRRASFLQNAIVWNKGIHCRSQTYYAQIVKHCFESRQKHNSSTTLLASAAVVGLACVAVVLWKSKLQGGFLENKTRLLPRRYRITRKGTARFSRSLGTFTTPGNFLL